MKCTFSKDRIIWTRFGKKKKCLSTPFKLLRILFPRWSLLETRGGIFNQCLAVNELQLGDLVITKFSFLEIFYSKS